MKGNGGGKGSGDGGGDDNGDGETETCRRQDFAKDSCNNGSEFTLVNSRNIEMKRFTGGSNSKMSYLEFNDSQRELVGIKGKDGDVLNSILTWAEQQRGKRIDDTMHAEIGKHVPKVWKYNRAIHASFKNWTEGDAKRLIRYELNGGTDAWRKLYVEYIPMAQTKHYIILSEILELKPVTDKHIRKSSNRVDELRYKYNRCGGVAVGDSIVRRVLVKCILKDVMEPLALHIEGATTFQQMRKLIMRQMHDELIGTLEGESAQPLYAIAAEEVQPEEAERIPEETLARAEENWKRAEEEYCAAALGKSGGGKGGKGKGNKGGKGNQNGGSQDYGECWNRGQHGHPARDCIVPGKLHGGVIVAPAHTAAAFKSKGGKNNWKGKGNGKNNWKGKGTGNWKGNLNVVTGQEYNEACQNSCNYDGDD